MTDNLLIAAIIALASLPLFSAIFLLIEKNKQNKQMHIHEQTAKKIDALIEKTKGKFFTLTFIKQDGTLRTINGKDKYNRLIVGTGSPATDALKAKGYKNAVNRNRETWVSFMPEKVVEFKCGAIHETF
jgi:phage/plasmid primase-like uncharacterized protein